MQKHVSRGAPFEATVSERGIGRPTVYLEGTAVREEEVVPAASCVIAPRRRRELLKRTRLRRGGVQRNDQRKNLGRQLRVRAAVQHERRFPLPVGRRPFSHRNLLQPAVRPGG